jgi:hypothetical protein
MAEALGVPIMSAALNAQAANRRYTPDRSDSTGPPREIGGATPTNLRWLRDPLRCPQIAELAASAAVVAEGRSEPSGRSGRVKNSKRAKLVGSPSESGPIVDRRGFFSLGPEPAIRAHAWAHRVMATTCSY